jgi:rod shape-determining protein MreB
MLTPTPAAARHRVLARQAAPAAGSGSTAADPAESASGADGGLDALALAWDLTVHRLDPAFAQCLAAPTDGRLTPPAVIAVDLGSSQSRLWAVGSGVRAAPTAGESLSRPTLPVRRGRIVDAAGCLSLLTRLLHTFPQTPPVAPVVVACRPVLSAPADQEAIRRVVTAAFVPSRVLMMDTVRAAAIGSGAATGVLLIVDVGAQLTEVAVLVDGRVAAARRAEVGTHDPASGGAPRLIAGVITRLVTDIGRNPRLRWLIAAALARGVILVGDGATTPELSVRLAAHLRVPVRPVSSPRLAALRGAGLAAAAARRHPATAAA